MDTQAIIQKLDLHKSIIGSKALYLKATKDILTIASASPVGSILVTKLKTDLEFKAINVDAIVFGNLIKTSKHIEFTIDSEKLSVKGKGVKGEIPFNVVETFPKILPIEKPLKESDADWLSAIIPYVTMPSLDKMGFFSAQCKKSLWSVCCTDNVRGAFAYTRGEDSNISFSLVPSDAINLMNFIKKTNKCKISVQEGLLILQTKNNQTSLALPLIEGQIHSQEEVVKDAVFVGSIDTAQFKEAFKFITPIASVKDASAIELNLNENNTCSLKAASSSGALHKWIKASVKKPTKTKLSFELLASFISLINGTEFSLYAVMPEKEVTRIIIKASNVYYLMVTSE